MIADIFVTALGGRTDLTVASLRSLRNSIDRDDYRLTVLVDGTDQFVGDDAGRFVDIIMPWADYVLQSRSIEGLGPTINRAIAHISSLREWDGEKAPPLTVYCQDDCVYSAGWLKTLSQKYLQLKIPLKLGFASGVECKEHPVKQDLGNGVFLKDWIRATNMMATHDVWTSMWPIPPIDAETGRLRGRPHNGLGSGVDWHFIRVHQNSICKTGRTNLVIPGLIGHAGYDRSTWLKRELPESDSDKKMISEYLQRLS